MLNRISLLTAVCMTASAGLFVTGAIAADDLSVTSKTTLTSNENIGALPAGINAKDLNSDKSIEKAFKAATDDALSKTGFDNLVGKLNDQDRDRIKKSVPNSRSLSNMDGSNNKRFTDLVNDLDNTFKSKYNQKFDIDVNKAYGADFLHIATGEVADPQLLVGKWPVDAMPASGMSTAGKVTQSDADIAKNKTFGGDVNLEKGRDVAVVHILDSHGMHGLTASMIHEVASGWKFDIPNTVNAETLYNTLVSNLNYLDTHKDTWPSDVNGAYREFTHAVTASLYNIDISTGMAMNGTRSPNNTANNR